MTLYEEMLAASRVRLAHERQVTAWRRMVYAEAPRERALPRHPLTDGIMAAIAGVDVAALRACGVLA
jgi:hypothetical protein